MKTTSLLVRALLVGVTLGGSNVTAWAEKSKDSEATALSKADWTGIRKAHDSARHAFMLADATRDVWKAHNSGLEWTATFDGHGFIAAPRSKPWQWGLQLKSYGFGAKQRAVGDKPVIQAMGQRLMYTWDATMQEWFVNDVRGLEQGFTLSERPESSNGNDPLSIVLAVRGNLHPRLTPDSRGLVFRDASGTSAVNYAGLKVWDADGRIVAAKFAPIDESDSSRVVISVDDEGARYPLTIDPLAQQAYLKPAAVGTSQAGDLFGGSVSISGDTIVVGSVSEDGSASGVNGVPNDSAFGSGAAFVFVRDSGGVWTQQAYLKASNPGANDAFGVAVSISGDTIVVGAWGEDSASSGVNSTPNEAASSSGAAYVFVRNGTTWTQQAYLKASNPGVDDNFGGRARISGDTIVIGASGEDGSSAGVNGTPNELASAAGAAYVFVRSGTTWSQQAYLKASNPGAGDEFGLSADISNDTIVVGAWGEASSTTGVDSTPNDSATSAGAAYVFVRDGTTWTQQAYLKASNTQAVDLFGLSVAISGDTVVVGARGEDSSTSGVNSTPNEATSGAGAAYVFFRDGTTWAQQAYLKASNPGVNDLFGDGVAISGDLIAVGAAFEDSSTTGVNSTPNEAAVDSGAVYLFRRTGTTWAQQSYLKANNSGANDGFGSAVAVSGETVVVGAKNEGSSSTGVNSPPNDAATQAGAAYVFTDFEAPELAVTGNGVDIATGDVTPTLADHTDFGPVDAGVGILTRTFTITNSGAGNLILGNVTISGADAADFGVQMQPDGVVPAGGTTTFEVIFNPSASVLRTATLSLSNNDGNENPFTFAIQGTGTTLGCSTINLPSLPAGFVGFSYNASATATGGPGPFSYAITAGALPPGLALNVPTLGRVGGSPTTAGTFTFEITATDGGQPGTCTGVRSYSVVISPEPPAFEEDFSDNSAGWTLGSEWQIGPAVAGGGGSGYPDPGTDTTATADNKIAGMVIGGNISNAVHGQAYLTSPPVNTSAMPAVELSFMRWLNSDYRPHSDPRIEVWNGSTWVIVWQAPLGQLVRDNFWSLQRIDLTAYSNPQLRVRFGSSMASGAFVMSGWNIDDVRIGIPTKTLRIDIASATSGIGSVTGFVTDPAFGTSTPFSCNGVSGLTISCYLPVRQGRVVSMDMVAGAASIVDTITGCTSVSNSPQLASCAPPFTMDNDTTVTTLFRGVTAKTLTLNVASVENGAGLVTGNVYDPSTSTSTPFTCNAVVGGTASCPITVPYGHTVLIDMLAGAQSVVDAVTGCAATSNGPLFRSCAPPFALTTNTTVTTTFRGPQSLTLNVTSVENGAGTVAGNVYDPSTSTSTPFTCDSTPGATATCTVPVRVGNTVSVDMLAGTNSVVDAVTGCATTANSALLSSCSPPFTMVDELTVTTTFRGPQTLTLNVTSVENGIGTVAGNVYDPSTSTSTPFTCDSTPGATATCTVPVRVGNTVSVDMLAGTNSVVDAVTGCATTANSALLSSCSPPFTMVDETTVTTTFRGPQTLTIQINSLESGVGFVTGNTYDPTTSTSTPFACSGLPGATATCNLSVRVGNTVSMDMLAGTMAVVEGVTGCASTVHNPTFSSCAPPISMIDDLTVTASFRGPQVLTVRLTSAEGGAGNLFGFVTDPTTGGSGQNFSCDSFGFPAVCTTHIQVGNTVTATIESTGLSVIESVTGCPTVVVDSQHRSCAPAFAMLDETTIEVVLRGPQNLGVSFSGDGSGSVSLGALGTCNKAQGTCSYPVMAGSVHTLTASPASDSLFQAWTGACAGQSAVCSLTVADDVSAQAVFVLKNHPPVAVTTGPYTRLRNVDVSFNGGASSDPDGNPLTYAWSFGDGATGTGVIGTHLYTTAGTYTVTLIVNDGTVDSAPATTTVTVINQMPVAHPGGPYTGLPGESITFNGATSSDPDGDALTYAWSFGDGGTATGVSPSHTYAAKGTYTVTLTVNDGTTNSTAATTTVAVQNRAPIANAGGPYTALKNETVSFTSAGSSDPDGDALTYNWSFGDGAYATGASPTHAYGATGAYTVTLTVNDGATNSVASTATVTIPNRAPTAQVSGPSTGVRNSAVSFNSAGSSDPDGDALTFAWDFGDGATGTGPAPSHAYATNGAFTVVLVASDGTASSVPATTTVTISNRAPIANAGGSYAGFRGQAVAFSGALSSDPDGDALTYAWTFGDGGTGTGVAPTHAYATNGTFTVTLTVNDGMTDSTTVSTTTVISNRAPIANPGGPYPGFRNTPISFSGAASTDPDGDALTYAWDFGDGSTGTGVSPSHAYSTLGTFTVTLTVNDGTASSAAVSTTVTTTNSKPVAVAGGPYTGAVFMPIAFNGAGSSDADGDPLTYQWTFGDTVSGAGVAPTHAYNAVGTFTARLRVYDGALYSDEVSVPVTVTNLPPVASAGGPYTAYQNTIVTFDSSASTDPNGQPLYRSWDYGDGTNGTSTYHTYTARGTYTATVTISDLITTSTATVTVNIVNRAPVAVINAQATTVRNQATSFSASASTDGDSDPLTYQWDFGDGATAVGVSATHAYAAMGTYTVTLSVNDGFTTTVLTRSMPVVNRKPQAEPTLPTIAYVNTPFTYSASTSTDADGDPMTYRWDFGDGTTSTLASGSHTYATPATLFVNLIANDGYEDSLPNGRTVYVINRAPWVINMSAPTPGYLNTPISFWASGGDEDGQTLTYAWDFGDGTTGTGATPTHAYSAYGTYTVSVTVNDGIDTSAPRTATLAIVNRAPYASHGGPYLGELNIPATFSAAGSTDAEGDAMTYSWNFGDGSTGTGVSPTHAYATRGSFMVTLTVSDGTSSSTATTTINVINSLPTANAGGPYSGFKNVAVAFNGAASTDPNGDTLTYAWDFGDGSTDAGVAPTHAYASKGTFLAKLTVNDGLASSSQVSATVTIGNQTPVANAGGPYNGVKNVAVAFSGAASADADGDVLTYAWNFGDGSTGTGVAPTHAYAAKGTFTATLTVSDGTATSTQSTATVTIGNQAPVANAGGNHSGTRLAAISFTGAASSDPDGDTLTYAWNFGDGGTATGATPTHLYTTVGTFTVSLTVSDGVATSAASTSTTTITNVAPTVSVTSPTAGAVFLTTANVTLTASAADTDGGVAKVEFFAGATKVGESTTAPYAVNWPATAAGTYAITAKVTDSNTATVTSSAVSVIRNAPPTVTLTAPANNAQYAAPASITLTATAADTDGTITSVQFFQGGTSLGTDSSSPYTVTWSSAPAGSYALTAVATDNRGAVVTSSVINVKVTAALAPTADTWVNGGSTGTNYGTATSFTVQQASSTNNQRWTYLKFDVSSVATITNAKVRVFGAVSATTGATIQTAIYPVTDTSWTETGLKWSNKPATGGTAITNVTIVNNSTTARWYELDVTAYLQAEKAAGRNVVTLALKNLANSTPFVTFTSKEGTAANRPQVLIVP